MIICPKCQRELSDDARFCDHCGAKLPEARTIPEREEVQPSNFPEKDRKTKLKSILLYSGFALAALILMGAMVALITKADNASPYYGFYLKDGELFGVDLSDKSTWQLSTTLVDRGSGSGADLWDSAVARSAAVTLSKDRKYIFYFDRMESGGATLYCKETSSKKDAFKIDTVDSRIYYVNDTASLVTYIKNGDLYQYNMKKSEKTKLINDVSQYTVSSDGKRIVCLDHENTLYLKKSGGEAEEIDREVRQLLLTSEDLQTVYYLKASEDEGDSLYKKTDGKDKVLIASDVYEVLQSYASGEFYFLRSTSTIFPALYYFDGSEEKELCRNFARNTYKCASGSAVMVFRTTDSDASRYVAVGGTVTPITLRGISYCWIDGDGQTIYYLVGEQLVFQVLGYGELYQFSIANGVLGEPVLFDSEVSPKNAGFLADGQFVYFKNVDADMGDMYANGTFVDKNVSVYGISCNEETQRIFYCTDRDTDCALKVYAKGKSALIDNGVDDYALFPGGDILYVKNYHSDLKRGDLCLYKNGRSTMVDTDVATIVSILESEDREDYFELGGWLGGAGGARD